MELLQSFSLRTRHPPALSFARGPVKVAGVVEQPPDDSAPLLNRAERIGAAAFAAAVGLAVTLVAPPPAALATAVLALLMGLITLIDFRHFIIPNALSYPAVPLGIAANVAVFHPGDWTAGLTESLLGAVVGAASSTCCAPCGSVCAALRDWDWGT